MQEAQAGGARRTHVSHTRNCMKLQQPQNTIERLGLCIELYLILLLGRSLLALLLLLGRHGWWLSFYVRFAKATIELPAFLSRTACPGLDHN